MNQYIKNLPTVLGVLLLSVLVFGCGKTSVEINDSTYEPKITINGLLDPAQPWIKVTVGRNFPIGRTIDISQIALSDADVEIIDLATGTSFPLVFNPDLGFFELSSAQLKIDYGHSYRLQVKATIDGKELNASSTTRVPDAGMSISRTESIVGDLYYRQKNTSGELVAPVIAFNQASNVAFYLLSFMAEDTSDANFIYENPMGADIKKMRKNGRTAKDLQYGAIWKRLGEDVDRVNKFESSWFWFWYYGRYRFILYAGDINYYHYQVTHDNVMGMDGNLHEPVFDIEGNGIGVFGSVITDTVYVTVLKP